MQQFVLKFIIPPLIELDLEDILPFTNPLPILKCYLKAWQDPNVEVEARLMHSSGSETAMPLYVAGIYANKELIGQCELNYKNLFF